MGKAIQYYNFFYSFFKPLVAYSARCHYRHFVVRDASRLPMRGGYILAPCHQQALMEPLAVLNVTRRPTVFLARADIFAKPAARAGLTFLKILPVYRIRDGKSSLSKNAAIFDQSRRVLLDGYPLCLMAEGRHNNRHQLLPLVKGMFRIAGEAQRQMGSRPLKIYPVGIDFDHYEAPYADVVVYVGEPIDVQQYAEVFETNEPVALNRMRSDVGAAMQHMMHDIRSTRHYDEIYTLSNILNRDVRKVKGLRNGAWSRFATRQTLSRLLDQMETEEDAAFEPMMETTRRYQALCREWRLDERLTAERWNVAAWLLSSLALLLVVGACVALPVVRQVVLFVVVCFPLPFVSTAFIPRRLIKDTQFRSSINYAIRFLSTVLYTLVMSAVVGVTHGLWLGRLWPGVGGFWWWLVAFDLPLLLAPTVGYGVRWVRDLFANWRYRLLRLTHSRVRQLDALRAELFDGVRDRL